MKVNLALTGRDYHLAADLPGEISFDEEATVRDALEWINEQLATGRSLPASCLISLSGRHLGSVQRYENASLRDGDELVLIDPVAGG